MARPPIATPATIAIQRLAKLAVAGTPVARMVATAQGIILNWSAESLPAHELRERIETLQADVDGGVLAAEDYVADADSDKGRMAAQLQLAGLTAVQEVLTEEIEKLAA